MNRKSLRAIAATMLAFAVAMLGLLAGSGSANAAPIINPDAEGSLTIHKYLGTPTGATNDGSQLETEPDLPKLSGVVFDLYRVEGVDLTTNEGWLAAKDLQGATITIDTNGNPVLAGHTLTPVTPSQATQSGVLTYGGLDVGLYLVMENLADSGTITDGTNTIDKASITPSAPFLVTVPISYDDPANPGTDTWVYDIHVYPKNTAETITKQVLDGNMGEANQDAPTIGDNLTYVLDSTVTNPGDVNKDGDVDGADLGRYEVIDRLSQYVTFTNDPANVKVTVQGTNVELIRDTDYTVAVAPWSYGGESGQQVTVTFTESGRTKLLAGNGHVLTEIVAEVTSLPADGLVPNKAYLIPNDSWTESVPGEPGVPSNEVVSKYGDIIIRKVGDNAEGAVVNLAGAIFEVYRAPAYNTCEGLDMSGDPLYTSLPSDATTGLTKLSGLQLSNWYNDGVTSGAITDPALFHNYCLVEIKAPTGYQLLAEPILFSLTVEGIVTDLNAAYGNTGAFANPVRDNNYTDATGGNLLVHNMPDNLDNNLPLTGGQGVALLSMLGLVLVGGGAAYYLVSARRKDA